MKCVLASFLILFASRVIAADIADPNAVARTVGTHVGVQGGIPTTRTNIINVMDYGASGSASTTTGTITSGTNSLEVASAAGWTAGMGITVGRQAVLTMTVTSAADGDGGYFHIKLPVIDPALQGDVQYSDNPVAVTASQSASSIATAVRAASFQGWTVTGGTGADVEFTCTRPGARPVGETWGGFVNSGNVSSSWVITTAGLTSARTTVTNVSGTTLTLDDNATNSVTDGIVIHRDDLAIQAAIAASSAEDIIYLPAGTYRLEASLNLGNYSNRTLRGAGPTQTILAPEYVGTAIRLYNHSDYAWSRQQYANPAPSSVNLITAGLTAGSETITIGDTTAFSNNQIIQIAVDNQYDNAQLEAGAVFVFSTFGFNTVRRPMHKVVSKTGAPTHTLTITPPVYWTPDSNLEARVNYQTKTGTKIGLEDFFIDGGYGLLGLGVQIWQSENCWMKNVKITMNRSPGQGMSIYNSIFFEMRKCDIRGPNLNGTSGAGILAEQMCASLIEDNIITGIQPPVEMNHSCVGNVLAYNFLNASSAPNLWVNHGPHNSHNLFEGFITVGVASDSWSGGASNNTFYRMWNSGYDFETNTALGLFGLQQWERESAVIGNIVGTIDHIYAVDAYTPWKFGDPWGGNPTPPEVQPSAGSHYTHWNNVAELTTRTSDTAGVLTITTGSAAITSNGILIHIQPLADAHKSYGVTAASQSGSEITFTGYSGTLPATGAEYRLHFGVYRNGPMNQSDLDARPTWYSPTGGTIVTIGNYNAHSTVAAIPTEQALGGSTLSASYYTTKAAMEARGVVWGNLTFPPFDPTNPGDLTQTGWERIPAGYRYMNAGADPPAGGATYTPGRLRFLRR